LIFVVVEADRLRDGKLTVQIVKEGLIDLYFIVIVVVMSSSSSVVFGSPFFVRNLHTKQKEVRLYCLVTYNIERE